ncbi:ribonuclease E inhibitor B, partial [Erwinia sp. MYb416]
GTYFEDPDAQDDDEGDEDDEAIDGEDNGIRH